MRRILLSGLVLVAVLAVPSLAAAKGQLLYSVSSADVRVTGAVGAQRVSLPASADLAWFTDRPARRSGHGTTGDLVAGWSLNGFNRTPPNAALVTRAHGTTMQTVVTLRDPRNRGGRVSFAYRVLHSASMLGMSTTGTPTAGRFTGELFVDDATLPPCPQDMTLPTAYNCVAAPGTTYRLSSASPAAGTSGTVGGSLAGCSDTNGYATYTQYSGSGSDLATSPAEIVQLQPCAQTPLLTITSATHRVQCTTRGRLPVCQNLYTSLADVTVSSPTRFVAPS